MSDFNAEKNAFVWMDIPVVDLDRARRFYKGVMGIDSHAEKYNDFSFAVLEHHDGNGGCLIPGDASKITDAGPLVYLNTNGRIRDAVAQTKALGGRVLQDVHSIGPHGCRAIILDSEGNRFALHSNTDA
jgi:predicted enzyme related to lactoylglutathione lyase